MAAPEPLELEEDMSLEEEDMGDEEAMEVGTGVDPMFAADVSEAFPDLDDAQIAALQRAVLGLTGGGAPPGGGMGGPPPMGF